MTSPETQIVRTNLPNLIAVMYSESSFFRNSLDEAVMAEAGMTAEDLEEITPEGAAKLQEALNRVNHVEVITKACEENPRLAARAIMPSIYMAGTAFSAQDNVETTGTVAPMPAAPEEVAAAGAE